MVTIVVNPQVELEWKTRKERIDKALAHHWTIIKYNDTLDTAMLTNHAVIGECLQYSYNVI